MQAIEFPPTLRQASGLSALEIDAVPLPDDFPVAQRFLVSLPPGAYSGNHRHGRRHAFVALTPGLQLHVEIGGRVRRLDMHGGDLRALIVPPGMAHAVVNVSGHVACMYELNDRERGEAQTPAEIFIPSVPAA